MCHAQAWRCILYTYFVNAFRSTGIHHSQQQISKVDEPKEQKAWRPMRRNIFSRDWTPRRSKENTALLYHNVQRSSTTLGYLNLFKYNWNRPRESNGKQEFSKIDETKYMFSKLNVKKIKGKQSSFVFNFVPLFNAQLDRNLTTQRVGKTCSPNSVKGIISRNQGAQGKHSKQNTV